MMKYVGSFVLFAAAFFCFPQTYAQEANLLIDQNIDITFKNLTDSEAHLTISEEKTKKPYTYVIIKEVNLAPGQVDSTALSLSINSDKKATLSISITGGEGYEKTASEVEIDVTQSNSYYVELTESWVYPGDGFWYIDPFRVIKAKVLN